MRTQLFRGALALVVGLWLSAPAFAQSIVKGTVVDAQGKPLANAQVVMESTQTGSRRMETKTNGKGEFLQVGLPSGEYNVTATSGQFKQTLKINVRQGENRPLQFQLSPQSGITEEDRKAQSALSGVASEGVAALQAKNYDLAITKFQEVIAKVPTCGDCYLNLGNAYLAKQDYTNAEGAFKKVIELKPDSAEAYSGLANLYNAQKKFDQAVEMSQKAAQLAGAGGAAGGNGEALYNQGVTLWNAQKYAEAKTQFEAAIKANPNMGIAYYQLGMANLNLGQIPAAKEAFQGYLKVEPNGAKAAEVQTFLKQLP